MNALRATNNEGGFTIQELVVVILVGSLLIGFSYSLYLFIAGFLHQNMNAREHKKIVDRAASWIIADIEKGRIVQVEDSLIVVEVPGNKSITYRVTHGKLMRGDMILGSGDESLWGFVASIEGDEQRNFESALIAFSVRARWSRDSCTASSTAAVPWSSYGAFTSAMNGKGR